MSEASEPQMSSIKARISALNLEQVVATPGAPAPYTYDATSATKKARPPPPPPPAHRKSTNNPPLQSNGTSASQDVGNKPAGPPPRSPVPPTSLGIKAKPALPARPALPPRDSQSSTRPVPALPPRRPSEQSIGGRKPSIESISSVASARTSVSAISSRTNTSSSNGNAKDEMLRIKAPAFDSSKLPPLPPKRQNTDSNVVTARNVVRPAKSSPSIDASKFALPDRSVKAVVPTLPARPALPTRPNTVKQDEPHPVLPARPGGVPKRSALEWGMNRATANPPPVPTTKPSATNSDKFDATPSTVPPANTPGVVTLTSSNFDSLIFDSGIPALVDFSAPYCRYCKELDPIYDQLADAFASQSDKVTIAKADVHAYEDLKERFDIEGYPTIMWFNGRNKPPKTYMYQRTLEGLTDFVSKHSGLKPNDRSAQAVPPPVPRGSRPDLAAIMASKPKPGAVATNNSAMLNSTVCLKCRDFSAPDSHAARFPRQSIPSQDLAWLANQLCSPFSSATDRARVIFTWLHHNIDYDTEAFFNKNVKHATPASTMSSGLAVCAGYSGLFHAIATHAGMESIVINGGSKGYGHTQWKPGDAIPPYKSSHAWNAVKIDNGEWKLIDSTWGAGHVQGPGLPYVREFNPFHFTADNDEFGEKHYPEDKAYFFRLDGRPTITWEEFITNGGGAETPTLFSCAEPEFGIGPRTVQPAYKHIKVHAPSEPSIIRFSFAFKCPHWDPLVHGKGKPGLMLLSTKGRGGKKDRMLPMQYDGRMWWLDIERVELGAPGQDLNVFELKTLGDLDGRDVTPQIWFSKVGKCGWSMENGLVGWKVV